MTLNLQCPHKRNPWITVPSTFAASMIDRQWPQSCPLGPMVALTGNDPESLFSVLAFGSGCLKDAAPLGKVHKLQVVTCYASGPASYRSMCMNPLVIKRGPKVGFHDKLWKWVAVRESISERQKINRR